MIAFAMTLRARIGRGLRGAALSARYASQLLLALESKVVAGARGDRQKDRVIASTVRHDMDADPDEQFYAERYWERIEAYLEACAAPRSGWYLDLGCGQGRLASRLGAWCGRDSGRVVGVDLAAPAVRQATSRNALASTVSYVTMDALDFLDTVEEASVDGVVLTEVTFFEPRFGDLLTKICTALRPNAVLAASFRPQYYYALCAVAAAAWDDAERVVGQRAGELLGCGCTLTWQTSAEVRALLAAKGFTVDGLVGIGPCSGIRGDPHSSITRPSRLSDAVQRRLARVEDSVGETLPDAGRYMLALARRA